MATTPTTAGQNLTLDVAEDSLRSLSLSHSGIASFEDGSNPTLTALFPIRPFRSSRSVNAQNVNNPTTTLSTPSKIKQPAPGSSLRFKDFPLEIRQQIYHILLCNFEPAPARASLSERLSEFRDREKRRPIELSQNNQIQVLLLDKAIYKEAELYMRKTNLFVKVVLNCHNGCLSRSLKEERLPHWGRRVKHDIKAFNHFVMVHEITHKEISIDEEKESVSVVFLWQHMDRWVDVLQDFTASLCELEEPKILHTVTLVDPYSNNRDNTDLPFFTLDLQEKLLQPYRKIQGMHSLSVNGVAPELAAQVIEDITRMPTTTQAQHLTHLQELKQKGNDILASGSTIGISSICTDAITYMLRNLRGLRSKSLFDPASKGVEFANHLCALHYSFQLQHAQALYNTLQHHPHSNKWVSIVPQITDTWHNVRIIPSYYRGATWKVSAQQEVRIMLLMARAGKVGNREAISLAKQVIKIARVMMPGCEEVREELSSIRAILRARDRPRHIEG